MTQTENSDTTPVIRYLADGVQREFPYPFRLFNDGDLAIFWGENQRTTGYSQVKEAGGAGGTVTFEIAPSAGVIVTLARVLDYRRLSDFQEGSSLRTSVLNRELDYQTALFQQLAEQMDRSLKKPLVAVEVKGEDLTLPQAQAGRALKWSGNGLTLVNSDYDPDGIASVAETAAQVAATAQKAALASQSAAEKSRTRAAVSEATALQAAREAAQSANDTAEGVPPASETKAGKLELATETETQDGTSKALAVHPLGLKKALDAASEATLQEALKKGVPVGTIIASASEKTPEGYLLCNGAPVSRTTYAALYAAIGTAFGYTTSTTFALPDLRGEFLRGYDGGRNVDKGRKFGSAQEDEFRSHNHRYSTVHLYTTKAGPIDYGHDRNLSTSYTSTSGAGGDETRPRNVAVNFYIKY